MTAKRLLAWTSAGLLSLLIPIDLVLANHFTPRSSTRARAEVRESWAEIRQDRAELERNIDEYHENRAALNRAIRRGAPPYVIAQRRAEVRQDLREIAQDRRELRRDYAELNADMERSGWYRHSDGRWYRSGRYDNSERRYGWWR
jgi:septal ring factor EnvC (AmiA/AmiB activator)